MMNAISPTWLIAGWTAILVLAIAVSRSVNANLSTTMLLAALGVAPIVVVALLKRGEAPPTMAELLHAVNAKERRP